jgi:hypothetical protein
MVQSISFSTSNVSTPLHTMVKPTPLHWIHSCAQGWSTLPKPPSAAAANGPVSSAPTMPATACTPKTSRLSS